MHNNNVIKKYIIGRTAVIRLNRPDSFNAINMDMAVQLANLLRDISKDPYINGLVITGEGKAFCAGGDLKWIINQSDDYYTTFYDIVYQFHKAIIEIHYMKKPVFAAINGLAAGGGLSLALACDFRIIESHAQFILAYTSRGLSIDGGGTYNLPRLVGVAKSMEIMAFDKPINSWDALELGLVTEVVDQGKSLNRSLELIEKITQKIPLHAYSICKQLIYESFGNPLEVQLEKERKAISWCSEHPNGKEGILSFLEKRKPVYKVD